VGCTVFGKGGMRHLKVVWLLEEMGVPFDVVPLSPVPDGPDYSRLLAMNPFGKLPVFQDGDQFVWETGAILTYLVDKHADKGLAPIAGSLDRALHDRWFFMAHTDLEEPLWTIARHAFVFPESLRSEEAKVAARADWRQKMTVLEACLPQTPFVMGENFSVADISLAYVLHWARKIDLLNGSPRLDAFLGRCMARPSCPLPEAQQS
jgi:glutathione S-transferase